MFYRLNVPGIHDQSSLFAFIRSHFIFSNCQMVNWELIAIENVIDLTKLIIFDKKNTEKSSHCPNLIEITLSLARNRWFRPEIVYFQATCIIFKQKWPKFSGFFDDNNYFNSFYFRRFSSKCDFHQFNRRLPLGSTVVTKTSWWTLFKIFLQRIIRKFPTYLVIYPVLWNGQVSKYWWYLSSYGSTNFYLK